MFEWVKYIALIVFGYAVGKLTKSRPPQLLFNTVVTLLIFTVSASAAEVFVNNAGVFIIISILYAAALVFTTAAVGSLFDRERVLYTIEKTSAPLYILTALASGVVFGVFVKFNYSDFIEPLLSVLLFLAGLDVAQTKFRFDKVALYSPIAALIAAAVVGGVFYLYFKITPAVAFGMGWYSFTSPFLANIAGGEEGVYGLLVNLLREQLTYITAPFLAKRFGKVGVLAVGGATTMDNTLPVYTALYGPSFALHAFANGVILTIITPLLVPLVYYATSV